MMIVCAPCVVVAAMLAQVLGPSAVAEDKAKAKALLQEGLALDRHGDKAQALEKFHAAYAAYPSPKLWLNIGQVQRDLGYLVEAIDAFEKFIVLVPDAHSEHKQDAKAAVAELGQRLGRLQVRCAIEGAEVVIDGKNAGKTPLPQPIWVSPGSHQLTVSHEGYKPVTENAEASVGSTTLLVVQLSPIAVATPLVSPTEAKSPASQTIGETATTAKTLALASVPLVAASPISAAKAAPVTNMPVSAVATPALSDFSAPVSSQGAANSQPIYARWWFWSGAAAVLVGAVAIAIIVSRSESTNVPTTALGNHGALP